MIAAVACLIGIGIGGASASSSSKKHDAATEPAATVTATVTASPAPAPQARTVTLKPTVIKTVATRVRIKRVVYTPPPPREYGDGTYVVGVDILPGTYHADPGQGYCAWITARDKSGTDLIDLNNTSGNGPLTVVITRMVGSVIFQGDCTFHRV